MFNNLAMLLLDIYSKTIHSYKGISEVNSIHEGMNYISNVKVHLRIRGGNVNILLQ